MQKLIIPGRPIPQSRPRIVRRGKFVTAYDTLSEQKIEHRAYLKNEYKIEKMKAPLKMHLVAYMPIPKSTSKKIHDELIGKPHIKRPDIDNITKYYLDMLDDMIFSDDSQVYHIDSKKIYSDEPRVELTFINDGTN